MDAAPRLHFFLCLGADFDRAYIPHLCRHYARTVNSWNVLLHSNDLGEPGKLVIGEARRAFESGLVDVSFSGTLSTQEWQGEFGPYAKIERLNRMIQERVLPGDWVLYLDADEFLDSPNTLRRLVVQCEARQQKVVYGQMVDRFAPDKQPKALHDDDDLFAKFSLSEEYTRAHLRAWTHKSCLMRYEGEPLLLDCHNSTGPTWPDYQRSGQPILTIWHFKWVETTREKLRLRVGSYQRQGLGWWPDLVKSLQDIYGEKGPRAQSQPKLESPVGSHPYSGLEARAFWRTGVADGEPADVWRPKWRLRPEDRVVTFGSCFARHLGPALQERGFTWWVTEPRPYGLTSEHASRYGYDQFSCRTGSLATPTALRQWIGWALGDDAPPDEYWTAGDRVVDPFRPSIEPEGFVSLDEMLASRQQALSSLRRAIQKADVLLFTLGMTESWIHDSKGWVYPACPGTIAGSFDRDQHRFLNLSFVQAHEALTSALERLWALRPGLRVLLTVSPVPLTATGTGDHVLAATTRSKAILRAVAGEVADSRARVDYFPSYELIMTPPPGETFFAPNRRSVSTRGVAWVMDAFFTAQGAQEMNTPSQPPAPRVRAAENDPNCDDAWAEAFGA